MSDWRGEMSSCFCAPEGFYFGSAAGMGSEISKKERQGLSKEKGAALK